MTVQEIQQEILRMKKEQDVCILAHAYQGQEILEDIRSCGLYGRFLCIEPAGCQNTGTDDPYVRSPFYGRNL